jgi:hypothetical protein
MVNPISHANSTQASPTKDASQPSAPRQPWPQAKPQPIPADTVQLNHSGAAQQASEAQAQTAKNIVAADIHASNQRSLEVTGKS